MTRCNIIITKGNNVSQLYRHCDGYPEWTGKVLSDFLNSITDDCMQLANTETFAKWLESTDSNFEFEGNFLYPTDDVEYLYFIHLDKKIIQCFGTGASSVFASRFDTPWGEYHLARLSGVRTPGAIDNIKLLKELPEGASKSYEKNNTIDTL